MKRCLTMLLVLCLALGLLACSGESNEPGPKLVAEGTFSEELYQALEDALRMQNIYNINACIASVDVDDEYLTRSSVLFHQRMGYRMVGEFLKCGYKFGRWYNMVWMEKILGDYQENQPPVRPYPEVANNK